MLKAFLSAISGLLSYLSIWKRGKERDKDRQSGEDRAVVRHLEGDIEASTGMRNIENATRRLTPTARRDALGRFMSNNDNKGNNNR